MKVPKSLTVFGAKYSVTLRELNENTMGLCDRVSRKIYINKDLKEDEIPETILHEMFHGVFERMCLGQIISPEVEELFCEYFSKAVSENFKLVPKK